MFIDALLRRRAHRCGAYPRKITMLLTFEKQWRIPWRISCCLAGAYLLANNLRRIPWRILLAHTSGAYFWRILRETERERQRETEREREIQREGETERQRDTRKTERERERETKRERERDRERERGRERKRKTERERES